MYQRDGVAIFWDYENCHTSSSVSGYEIVNSIRCVAHAFGSINVFKAYLSLSEQPILSRTLHLRSELQTSGVSLIDCPHNGRKDVADKMMLVDMLAHAIDHPAPSTIILISGDRDFAYAASILRLRKYQVVLVAPPTVHISLKAQASVFVDWSAEVMNTVTINDVGPPPSNSILAVNDKSTKTHSLSPSFSGKPGPALEKNALPMSPVSMSSQTTYYSISDSPMDEKYLDDLSQPGSADPRSETFNNIPLDREISLKPHYSSDDEPLRRDIKTVCSTNLKGSLEIPEHLPKSNSSLMTPQSLSETQPLSPTKTISKRDGSQKSSEKVEAIAAQLSWSLLLPSISMDVQHPTIASSRVVGNSPNSNQTVVPVPSVNTSTPSRLASSDIAPLAAKQVAMDISYKSNETINQRVVDPIFQLLVERLEYHRSKGIYRPFRSPIAIELASCDKMLYKRAGVEKFGQYVALAVKAGIVELGGLEGGAWISLHSDWDGKI